MAGIMDMMRQYGGKRKAAELAAQDGLDWNELEPEDKEFYISKAYQQQQDKEHTTTVGR